MLCDICKKNDATIHIKEIVGGEQKSLNLCSGCAAEHEKTSNIHFGAFNLAEMLYNLGKLTDSLQTGGGAPPPPSPTCPRCGWTLQKLRESGGRLGCPQCYETFAPLIGEALENVHRGRLHLGKRPDGRPDDGSARLRTELIRRRHELDELVQCENYEQAAVVRDRLRDLQKQLDRIAAGAPEGAGA